MNTIKITFFKKDAGIEKLGLKTSLLISNQETHNATMQYLPINILLETHVVHQIRAHHANMYRCIAEGESLRG